MCATDFAFITTAVKPDMSDSAISNSIRKLRFEHGEMTQQALAERIGVTRQTVNAIELGKYSPSLEVSFRIAAVFGKPLDAVFQYSPAQPIAGQGIRVG